MPSFLYPLPIAVVAGLIAAPVLIHLINLMRHRLGLKLGLVTLIGSLISTLITCAAEVGGMALILNYLTGAPYLLLAVLSVAALADNGQDLLIRRVAHASGAQLGRSLDL